MKLNQEAFEEILSRNLACSQSIITDLASYPWPKNAFNGSSDLLVELTSLLDSLQPEKRNLIHYQIQEQMDLLITTLQSLSSQGN